MPAANDPRNTVTGWGADLDPKTRPGVPRERTPPMGTGAHWDEPERQVPHVRIFKSTEHKSLTPVFGTACPPAGLSGAIRSAAYKLSEGQKAHWLLLLLADRVNVAEGFVSSAARGRFDNPFSEMGWASEFRRHGGFMSRFGQNRSDIKRQRNEALLILGAMGAGAYLLRNKLSKPAD